MAEETPQPKTRPWKPPRRRAKSRPPRPPRPPQRADAAATPEWDAGEAQTPAERILNQDEIDSLLGFDLSDRTTPPTAPASAPSSIRPWSPYERLPMLEIVLRPPGAADDHLVAQFHLRQCRGAASTTFPRSGSATI